ncbi:tRNA epoxyqueuosine(34) reductase QueG [Vibrio salinus]|uniref:tRNA epoxyqueuosine(34) reductase QueG n=1 Tax=Vibrio salinus TaxID=2899784 RepID=UPI001E314337|nr:tRNA epoxyqueuosine(34) reductase QueG [Vibrio salinus]MCE0493493.1 tRNA epoxyqueuosine(34) reductase QueG [Vibrio salinus]
MDYQELANKIKIWAKELGFDKVGITDVDLSKHEKELQRWLDAGYHGDMDWMARHGMMRARPDELLPGTIRVISARMHYLPVNAEFASTLNNPELGYISRYAVGRDYHKVVRNQLKKLGNKILAEVNELQFRPFVDSAPILERPLAEKAGLGWRGKHSLLLDKDVGSWFFLGELLVDIPLPTDSPGTEQCGSCKACITSCPTNAILSEGIIDSRKCISYLTIEYSGVIPEEYRKAMGNRIYGCDDCQLVCPWNRNAPLTRQNDFERRPVFNYPELITLFSWDEHTFLKNLEGSPIRRIGYEQWLRNISIAMGNAPFSTKIVKALKAKKGFSSLLDVHIDWALKQHEGKNHTQSRQHARLIRIIEKGIPRDA